MSSLDKDKSWLAAEYALGVSEGSERREAENLVERDVSFRKSVDAWQNQLSPILEEVEDVPPPAKLWTNIEKAIAPAEIQQQSQTAIGGIWKLLTAFTSTAAVACLGGLLYISGGDFSSGTITDLKQQLASSQSDADNINNALTAANEASNSLAQELASATSALANAEAKLEQTQSELQDSSTQLAQANGSVEELNEQLAAAKSQVSAAVQQVASAQAEVSALRKQYETARPLVASLTQSGDAPAFVAQYDPVKQSLLIRTAVEDNDEKVPEIWLIPAQGDRKGEVLSLGVMDESAPDEVKITDDFVKLIGEGGTLAITMEPAGGSPTGVATGPVIALGQLQSF